MIIMNNRQKKKYLKYNIIKSIQCLKPEKDEIVVITVDNNLFGRALPMSILFRTIKKFLSNNFIVVPDNISFETIPINDLKEINKRIEDIINGKERTN